MTIDLGNHEIQWLKFVNKAFLRQLSLSGASYITISGEDAKVKEFRLTVSSKP